MALALALTGVGCGSPTAPTVHGEQPRLIAPYANSRLSVRAPMLRWQQARGEQRLIVCRSRACPATDVVFRALVTGASARVASELAPGRYYWRVEADNEGVTRTSATWSFQVPQRSAPVEAVVGTYFDAEGDGRDDVVALTQQARLVILRGGSTPSWRALDNPVNSAFGVGDFNGDGLSDVGVGACVVVPPECSRQPRILGSSSDSTDLRPLAMITDRPNVTSVSNAGDVDGDGYGDVIALTVDARGEQHAMFIVHGGPEGVARTTPSIGVAMSGGSVRTAASAGDVDADGFADVVATQSEESAQVVSVYYGGAEGIDARRRSSTRIALRRGFWPAVASAGDVNGDGYADVVVGTPSAGNDLGGAWIGYGGPRDRALTRSSTVLGSLADGQVGNAVSGVGDIDGDGYDDIAAAGGRVWGSRIARGVLSLWRGGATDLSTGTTLTGAETFGHAVAGPTDIDGDGLFDVIGHELNSNPMPEIRAMVFRGRAGAMPSSQPEFVTAAGAGLAGWLG